MFYFIHVQGQNALTTLLHLADEMFWLDPLLSPENGLFRAHPSLHKNLLLAFPSVSKEF